MRLEPLALRHLEEVGAILADPQVLRFTRIPVPTPPGFARTFHDLYAQGRRDGTRAAFAIVDEDDGGVLGIAVAPRIDRSARTAELGYVVAPEARGRGVATQALLLLTDWGFDELDALRLELLIGVDNDASKRVAAHCGYVHEGVLRSTHLKQDIRMDTEIWSRLPTDAAPTRAGAG